MHLSDTLLRTKNVSSVGRTKTLDRLTDAQKVPSGPIMSERAYPRAMQTLSRSPSEQEISRGQGFAVKGKIVPRMAGKGDDELVVTGREAQQVRSNALHVRNNRYQNSVKGTVVTRFRSLHRNFWNRRPPSVVCSLRKGAKCCAS